MDIVKGHNIRKIGRRDGHIVDVLGTRQNWKVRSRDVGYAFGIYEMELAPGGGVPLHSHAYPEYFYVLEGAVDFGRIGEDGKVEWLRCQPGESVIAPINAPHALVNRSDAPARFTSTSTYYHEALFEEVGVEVAHASPPTPVSAEEIARFAETALKYQGVFLDVEDSGRIIIS